MAVDAANNLYVASWGSNQIVKFAASGGAIAGGSSGTALDTFTNVTVLVIDSTGNLYAGNGNGVIRKYPAAAGIPGATGIDFLTGGGSLSALLLDSSGNLYAADAGNGNIYKITAGASPVVSAASVVYVTLAAGSAPQQMALDTAGNLYVADSNNGQVVKIDADTKAQSVWISGLSSSSSLAIDSANNLYLTDGAFLYKYPASGGVVSNASRASLTPLSASERLLLVAPDKILVSDFFNGSVTLVTVDPASSNANLSNLALSSGTLSPVFAAGTVSYTAAVGNATTAITVTPTVADATATVKVNGTAVTSGSASGGISLNVGSNTIAVLVTAQDGTTTKTYTVTVTRAAAANADLSNLAVSSGTLSPVFAAGTVSYTAAVGNAVTSITVTPTVADATATVKVNGTAVTSGSASGGISLNVGANTIAVLVTAQDGSTTKTYTVTVTRADAAGQCGSAQGVTTVFPPAANLCNAGVGSTVSRVGSNWSWSCTGGASTASCTAPLQDTATHAGVGFATVVDDANHWVVDAANSAGFIPVTGHAKSPSKAPPAGYRFPYGLFDVKLITGAPNTEATVVITYPQPLPPGAVYWKYGPKVVNGPSDWYVFSGAVIAGNTVTLTLKDQGAGDSDLGTPSSIIDPGGVAEPLVTTAQAIPTLSEWAQALLGVLLAVVGVLVLRRRHA